MMHLEKLSILWLCEHVMCLVHFHSSYALSQGAD